jgi:hypothetical protein
MLVNVWFYGLFFISIAWVVIGLEYFHPVLWIVLNLHLVEAEKLKEEAKGKEKERTI